MKTERAEAGDVPMSLPREGVSFHFGMWGRVVIEPCDEQGAREA